MYTRDINEDDIALTWKVAILLVIEENVDATQCLCWALDKCQLVYFPLLLFFSLFCFPRVPFFLCFSVLNSISLAI